MIFNLAMGAFSLKKLQNSCFFLDKEKMQYVKVDSEVFFKNCSENCLQKEVGTL